MNDSNCKLLVDHIHSVVDNKYLFGDLSLIDLFLTAFLARGHVLLEGPPGTGKTLTAKLLAHLLAKTFRRIQFTSDMLPADITGAHIYSASKQAFDFIPGPLFADVILADEINRTPPRTQSALLEAMEERQATVEGKSFPLSPDFFVVATQNPQDFEGTFPLPEAQMDRFIFKLTLTHSPLETEASLLASIIKGDLPPPLERISPVEIDRNVFDQEIQSVTVDQSLCLYTSRILEATRKNPALTWGSSVRGGIALLKCSRILALISRRSYVTPDDIKKLLIPTLQHRIKLTPDAQLSRVTEADILQEILKTIPFPS